MVQNELSDTELKQLKGGITGVCRGQCPIETVDQKADEDYEFNNDGGILPITTVPAPIPNPAPTPGIIPITPAPTVVPVLPPRHSSYGDTLTG